MKAYVICLAALAATVAGAEPLQEFEELVARCRQGLAANIQPTQVSYLESDKAWIKRESAAIDVTYDVKRTESLVSPYTAYLEGGYTVRYDKAPDQAAAEALDVSGRPTSRFIRRINFAYQGGRWEATGGRFIVSWRDPGAATFTETASMPTPRSDLDKLTSGPMGRCVR